MDDFGNVFNLLFSIPIVIIFDLVLSFNPIFTEFLNIYSVHACVKFITLLATMFSNRFANAPGLFHWAKKL